NDEARAVFGGDGAAPALDCRGISTDDRLWFASFLPCSIAPLSKHFFSRQNGGAGSFCGQCMDLSQHGRSAEDRVGFRSCSASRREMERRCCACVVGRSDRAGPHDSLPSVLVRLQQTASARYPEFAGGLYHGFTIDVVV